jgi:hypothetical protein
LATARPLFKDEVTFAQQRLEQGRTQELMPDLMWNAPITVARFASLTG